MSSSVRSLSMISLPDFADDAHSSCLRMIDSLLQLLDGEVFTPFHERVLVPALTKESP